MKKLSAPVAAERRLLAWLAARLPDRVNIERLALIYTHMLLVADNHPGGIISGSNAYWKRHFAWLTRDQIRRALDQLDASGLIKKHPHGAAGTDYLLAEFGTDDTPNLAVMTQEFGTDCQNTPIKSNKNIKEPAEAEIHMRRAAKFHDFIQGKLEEFKLYSAAKLKDEETARVLRLFEEKDGIDANLIWRTLQWAWEHRFTDGTIYGSLLTSPAQWRNNGKMLTAINKYKQGIEAAHERERRTKTDAEYYGTAKREPTPQEVQEAEQEAKADMERRWQAWRARTGYTPPPGVTVDGESDFMWMLSDGGMIDKRQEATNGNC